MKCWKSGKRSCLSIESVNGEAFVNFSVFLANPSETYFYQDARRRNPLPPKGNKRKKSSLRKSNVITSVCQAEMSVKAVSDNFSFAFPAAEDEWEPSPENLQQQLYPPSLTLSQNVKNFRKNHPGPTLENITISEENQETASKETECPRLDFGSLKLSQSALWERGATPRGSARKPREAQKWVLRGRP